MNRITIAALIPSIAGCSTSPKGSTREEPSFAVRDSAGIEIVESLRPLWKADEAWWLTAEPEIEIGMSDGEDAYVFDQVTDLVRFDDGSLVVANSRDNTLRYYDETGSFLRRAAGRGGGTRRVHGAHLGAAALG